MPKRIDKLTPEQEARLGEWRDKWIKIGLCCEPADRKLAEAALAACYRHTKLEPPKAYVWVQSPLTLAYAGPTAAMIVDGKHAVGGAVGGGWGGGGGGAVGGAVLSAGSDGVGGAVGGAVHRAVGGAVGGAVHGAV